MLTWDHVKNFYDQYQEGKGSFRKFFSLDSIFMVSLAAMLSSKEALSTPLSFLDRFQLIELVFLHAPKEGNRLTHQLAYQLADQCVSGDEKQSVMKVFQMLYQLQLFNKEIFTSVLNHSHRNYLCLGLLYWHNAVLTKQISAQAQQDYKDNTLGIGESAACFWGDFQIAIGNVELGHEQHRSAMQAKAEREGSVLSVLLEPLAAWTKQREGMLCGLATLQAQLEESKRVESTYQLANEAKEIGAAYGLAQYYRGQGASEAKRAVDYYTQAMLAQDARAMPALEAWSNNNQFVALSLAIFFHGQSIHGEHSCCDITQATHYYQKASQLGSAQADFALAQLYSAQGEAKGVDLSSQQLAYGAYLNAMIKGHVEATAHVRALAIEGELIAVHTLGLFEYQRGDVESAIAYLGGAEKRGYAPAVEWFKVTHFSVAVLLKIVAWHQAQEDSAYHAEKIMAYYHRAAAQDHCPSLLELAARYQVSTNHRTADMSAAFACYLQLINLGREQFYGIAARMAQDGGHAMQTQLAGLSRQIGGVGAEGSEDIKIQVVSEVDLPPTNTSALVCFH